MAQIRSNPRFQALKDDNSFAIGWKLYSYAAGTSTPLATYTDQSEGTPNANPVVLDGSGSASVWLATNTAYKLILKDDSDVVQWTEDAIGQTSAGVFTTISASGQITSTVTTGTAPFVVASTTVVTNLNADKLDGKDWAAPAAIGGTTAAGATFTSVVSATVTATSLLQVGNAGTALSQVVVYSPSITPSSVGAATVAEQTFTVTGLTTADKVIVNPPAIANATGIAGARASAADTLAVRFVNPTAGALTPTAGVYTVIAFRS
jgi:hypothetical protein